jgi:chromosome segregation ATPase
MARTALAQSQLAELPERVGILETKVENINEKIGEVKADIKEMHDCLDRTRDTVMEELKTMQASYWENADKYYEHAEELHAAQCAQHEELAGKIKDLQSVKDKGIKYGMALLAFLAGSGWVHAMNLPQIFKFLGL